MRDYSEKSSESELDFAKKMTYGLIFDRNFYFCIEKNFTITEFLHKLC